MSYILDALKRADSEREREREDVPGLHSKTDTWVAPDEVRTGRSQPQPLIWALAGAGLLLVLGLLWFLLARETAPAASVASVAAPAAAVPPAPPIAPQAAVPALPATPPTVVAPGPAVAPAPAPVARAAPAAMEVPAPAVKPVVPRAARTVEAAVAAVSAPPPPVQPKAQAVTAPAPASESASVTKPAPLPAPTASAATSAEARLYTLSELPEDVRAGLPALTVGGAMYSQTPANRMLIINGQVFREGDTLAPGLVLEQIKLKSAVLKVKGLRFGISY
jgi:general secretion pathway protein B